jgi:hypothetical protein
VPQSTGDVNFKVVARGTKSVSEMVEHCDEARVFFALLRFDLGQGAFARTKWAFLHWNGENTSAVKRGRWNATLGEALSAVGLTPSLQCEYTDKASCTTEAVLAELASACVNDSDIGDSDFSIDKMKADFEAMLTKADSMSLEDTLGRLPTANDMKRKFTWEECQAHVTNVGPPPGPFNWMLVEADFKNKKLHNAGGGGVVEIQDWLDEDKVLFGLLRMGFGRGKFRRTKFVFVHWSGPGVSAVKRGQFNAYANDWDTALGHQHVSIASGNKEDFAPEAMIERISKAIVRDSIKTDDESSQTAITLESYLDALKEDQERMEDEFGDEMGGKGELSFAEALASIKDAELPYNFLLFSPP